MDAVEPDAKTEVETVVAAGVKAGTGMRLGPHVSRYHASGKDSSIVDHIKAAFRDAETQDVKPKAAQYFIMGPKNRTLHLKDGEAEETLNFAKNTGTTLIVHSAYINTNPWRGNPLAAASIREELKACTSAGVSGLVCHLPVGPHEWVWQFLPRLITGSSARIYLEHVASLPKNSHYETPAKIAALFRGIQKIDPTLRKFGFCIDTAHVWACGIDIGSYEKAEAWLNDLESISSVLPPEKIMLHLNDNRWELGAGKDEHSPLLEGAIWSKYKGSPGDSGLAAFVDYAKRNDTIVILERKPAEKLLSDYRVLLELDPDLKA